MELTHIKMLKPYWRLRINGPGRLRFWDAAEPFVKLIIVAASIGLVFLALRQNVLFNWHAVNGVQENSFLRYLFFSSACIFLFSWVFRTYFWFRYRHLEVHRVGAWPTVSVIVPAYNEGASVVDTLLYLLRIDYPKDKLDIVVVNDGSTDDTGDYIAQVSSRHPGLRVVSFPQNRGKRRALYAGIQHSKAEIIVTVDSDTRLAADALKEIVTPLALNPRAGAVTGRIRVWNQQANIITKMLKTNFAMAFDYARAVQSSFGNVLCSSGAFTAYRAAVLRRIAGKWLHQKFLGRPCTYGEDRSLTNHFLRLGYRTLYQRTAVAYTIVPNRLIGMLKMFCRWSRSNIRESIVFAGFMFNRLRKGNRLLPFIEYFSTVVLIVLHITWFYYFLFSGLVNGNFILRLLACSVVFCSVYSLYYMRIEKSTDVPYLLLFSLFSTLFMTTIFTVAGLTITRTSWSTR